MSLNPTVTEIVIRSLIEQGFDGLYSPQDECGCTLDNLAPCESLGENCRAGYLHQQRGPHGWGIYPDKPKGDSACQPS